MDFEYRSGMYHSIGRRKFRLTYLVAILLFGVFYLLLSGCDWSIDNLPFIEKPGQAYYVSPEGDDTNLGTQELPWQSIQMALSKSLPGDTIFLRKGEYESPYGGWVFANSGTSEHPITLTNFPGEQAVIKITQEHINYSPFRCWSSPEWQTVKADYIRLIGTDVSPTILANGVSSEKGLVIQGPDTLPTRASGIRVLGCDNWEVAGIDFVDVGYAIFTYKIIDQPGQEHNPTGWFVHDNRVFGFWAESGMQFNGDENQILGNQIFKIHENITTYGCQGLNLLGHNNLVKGNIFSREGSQAECSGVLLEWDLSDFNIIERNILIDDAYGIVIAGGDNNVVRNNLIYRIYPDDMNTIGILIASYDDRIGWPCNEPVGLIPPEEPDHPDFLSYYNPRNCSSFGNTILNNTISNYGISIKLQAVIAEDTSIRNNALAGWLRGSICQDLAPNGRCNQISSINLIADHNFVGIEGQSEEDFGFADSASYDFHPAPASPLIDSGYPEEELVVEDLDGIARPQGSGHDIGSYEYQPPSP